MAAWCATQRVAQPPAAPDFAHLSKERWWDGRRKSTNLRMGPNEQACGILALKPAPPGQILATPSECEKVLTSATVRQLCEQGQIAEAVEALGILVETGCRISQPLFYTVAKGCVGKKDLILGRRVHAVIVKGGCEGDTFLCNHVLRMYAAHARLGEAMDVFELVARPDAFTWSAIISAHVKHGQDKRAIQLYRQMRRSGLHPDGHVFVAALQACARGADLETGQQVHADVLAAGAEADLFVCNGLVDMYAKCGSLDEARRVFDGMSQKDVVTWTALIAGYSQQGMGEEALFHYSAMQEEGIAVADSVTFVCLLQACASVGISVLEKGIELHAQIGKRGLLMDAVLGCSLVNMYVKCGSLKEARSVFDDLREKNVVTWTALIAGYSEQGKGEEALNLYAAMQDTGMAAPNSVTFVCLLQACASVGTLALEKGKQLHAHIGEQGLQADVFVANSLVNMYAKCGSLEDAQGVFDALGHGQKNVVTWNAMIAGYSQQGMGQEALGLYRAMQEEGMIAPDSVTFVCLLQACASLGTPALDMGMQLHTQIRECGLQREVIVANSLVNMYAKCGSLEEAKVVFDGLCQKNVVSWTTLIAGYSQQGMGQEALRLYKAMQEEGTVAPNSVTFVCLLQACAHVAALDLGRDLHLQIEKQGLQSDALVAVSLVDMYAKSGSMVDAQLVFDALPKRDVVAWNALISGYTRQGNSDMVFDLFHRMREDVIQPAGATLLSVLTVCSHVGLVNEGQEYFKAMTGHYGVTPTVEHYTCMVDLLGRAGQVEEALGMIQTMPMLPDAAVWHTLLGACQKWSNVEVGLLAFDEAVKLDKTDAAAYVLMSNIYTSAQMWEQAQDMQVSRKGTGALKQPGQSFWTDLDGQVHSFLVEDLKPTESAGHHTDPKHQFFGTHVAGSLVRVDHPSLLLIVKCLRVFVHGQNDTAYISKVDRRIVTYGQNILHKD